MATIQDLPEEVLNYIFAKLRRWDIRQCQKVCRSWYRPAHILLLKEIDLYEESRIGAFIRSIDYNPDPEYLKSVRNLSIYGAKEPHYPFGKEMVRKLLFWFPNLRKLSVRHYPIVFQEFDQELCNEIIQNCPKLESFSLRGKNDTDFEYLGVLHKLRLLLTTIDAGRIDSSVSRFGSIVQFITSFPRLQTIYNDCDMINSFEVYMHVFERLDNLTSISLYETMSLGQNFAEIYFESKPRNVQDLIVERLSKVTELEWESPRVLSPHSIKFAAKYFTGLKDLFLDGIFLNACTISQKEIFWDGLVKLLGSTTTQHIKITSVHLRYLGNYLVNITCKIFQQASLATAKKRSLEISINNDNVEADMCNLAIYNYNGLNPTIVLDIEDELSLKYYMLPFRGLIGEQETYLDGVDAFIYTIKRRSDQDEDETIQISFYQSLLGEIPSIRDVTFDIPEWFSDEDVLTIAELRLSTIRRVAPNIPERFSDEDVATIAGSQVESLTLRPMENVKFQNLLDCFATTLTSLKHLNLYYFSGVWGGCVGEFRVDLGNYALEKLCIDTTPVKKKMKKTFKRQISPKEDFFVVEIETLSTGKRSLFKVSLDLKTITTITCEDLHGYVLGKDYFRIRIMISSLQSLELCMYLPLNSVDNYFDWPWDPPKRVIFVEVK